LNKSLIGFESVFFNTWNLNKLIQLNIVSPRYNKLNDVATYFTSNKKDRM
jgi:hypothetical protein